MVLDFLQLTRSGMAMLIVGAFVVGVNIADAPLTGWSVVLLSAALFAVIAGGFAINDYFDVEKDRINRPDRPIPAGRISRPAAFRIAVTLFGLASIMSLSVDWRSAAFTAALLLGVIGYTYMFRRWILLSNVITALITISPFVLSGLWGGETAILGIAAGLTFVLILGREIVKDIVDTSGDRAAGISTLPVIMGEGRALAVAACLFGIFIAGNIVPSLFDIFNGYYVLVVNILLNTGLAVGIVWMIARRDMFAYRFFLQWSHALLALGIFGIAIGTI